LINKLKNLLRNKGKSAGYRIYYYIQLEETTSLLTIYDKLEVEMIDESLSMDLIEDL